tara:strand:- start:3664 stop:4902 length:1239 start_codon:yes stop_codon:yes gene_type:complete
MLNSETKSDFTGHVVTLRNRFFRAYGFWHWGEGLQTVLFTWYMAFHANLSATEIGFYQALVLSPFLIFTISGGALTDRIGARLSYVLSTSLFGIILISYGILDHYLGFVAELFFLYCILAGIVSAISNPAIDTFIPGASNLRVQDNSLLAANAHNVAKLTGNLTGLLLPILTATGGFVVNGILMMVSVGFLSAHKPAAPPPPSTTPLDAISDKRIFRRIVDHYRACPENFDIFLSSALLGLIIVPAGYILMPLVLRQRFPDYGDLIAFIGISSWIGAILATVTAKQLSPKIHKPGVVSLSIWGGYGIGLLVLTVVSSFQALCIAVFVFGGVKVGKALVYGNYLHNSPIRERGLFVAIDQTAFWGLATLGTAGMGFLVDQIGLNPTIIMTSILITLGVVTLTLRGNFIRMVQA